MTCRPRACTRRACTMPGLNSQPSRMKSISCFTTFAFPGKIAWQLFYLTLPGQGDANLPAARVNSLEAAGESWFLEETGFSGFSGFLTIIFAPPGKSRLELEIRVPAAISP